METFLNQCQAILEAQGFSCRQSEHTRSILVAEITNDKEDQLQVIVDYYNLPDKPTVLQVEMRQRFFHKPIFNLSISQPSEIMQLLAKDFYVRLAFPACLTSPESKRT